MDNVKDNSYYLNKIISDLEFIIYHMESVDIEQLSKNDILLDSMLFRMIQISENAKNLIPLMSTQISKSISLFSVAFPFAYEPNK